ncbi:hypothetical protein HPB47_025896 [Ixodes persulcatus]|uniref:Uncharacterized protein n=1 Tax=Ixodes persulcatus TaxID=34615 RepID=A0AC60Q231_IXOPE|nr:hypothetical protein HPB47_025896 [Ixodes persulcatus]
MSLRSSSLHSNHKAATGRYSLPSSICGDSIFASEADNNSLTAGNPAVGPTLEDQGATTSQWRVITPPDDMEMPNIDDEGWTPAKTSKKRKKPSSNSSTSTDTIRTGTLMTEGLTVIFVPAAEDTLITSLSSLKVSDALNLLCPECIIEIRYNRRLNLIAVDTRNGQTTRALLDCKKLCGIPVRTYEPLPRNYAVGVITEVDTALSEADVWKHLRSPENRVARLRRFGQSSAMKISFCGTKLPNFVYLGLVRHPVTLFKERPIQCRKCCRYGHREASCKNPPVCNRCSGTHPDTESCTAQEKCVNCGEAHSAKSPSCPKWRKERKTRNYARHHAVNFRTAKVALQEPNAPNPTKGSDEFPPLPQMSVAGGTGKQVQNQHTYASISKGQGKGKPRAGISNNGQNSDETPQETASEATVSGGANHQRSSER